MFARDQYCPTVQNFIKCFCVYRYIQRCTAEYYIMKEQFTQYHIESQKITKGFATYVRQKIDLTGYN